MAIKRSRPTSVCQFCRKRKVKCDKQNPCSTCVKYENKECIYETFPTISEDTMILDDDEELLRRLKGQVLELEKRLKLTQSPETEQFDTFSEIAIPLVTVVKPEVDTPTKRLYVSDLVHEEAVEDDEMNLFHLFDMVDDSSPSGRRHFGPLSSSSVLRSDPLLYELYLGFNNNLGKDKFINVFSNEPTQSDWQSEHEKDSKSCKAKNLMLYGDIRSTKAKSNESVRFKKNQLNERAKILGLMFFEGEIETKIELISKIKMILPKSKEIGLLLDVFFNRVYPCFAIVDEDEFRDNIERILGPITYKEEKITSLNVEKRLDFGYLGMLLVILRLTYLSLFTNIHSINEYNLTNTNTDEASLELKYLLNNPINLEVINVAQICLNQFNLVNNINIVILQLAIFIRYYKLYGPEYGDEVDSGEPQVFSALLIQMAYSLGLHREPEKSEDGSKTEKFNHLGRKIWWILYSLNLSTSLTFGDPSFINPVLVDVSLPGINDANTNCRDVRLDKIIVILISNHPITFPKLNELFSIISNVKDKFSIQKVDQLCDYCYQSFANDSSETFVKFMEDDSCKDIFRVYYKSFKIKYLFQITAAIMALNFHFINYYNKMNNYERAIHFFKKSLSMFYSRCFPLIVEILTNDTRKIADICDLIVTPSLQNVLHITCLISFSLLIRVKLLNMELSQDSNFGANMFFLENTLIKSLTVLINFMKCLGDRYYAPWKVAKVLPLLLEEVNKINPQNYQSIDTSSNLGFTNEDLIEISQLISNALGHSTHEAADALVTDQSSDLLWLLITALRRNESEQRFSSMTDFEASMGLEPEDISIGLDKEFESFTHEHSSYLDEIFKDFFQK